MGIFIGGFFLLFGVLWLLIIAAVSLLIGVPLPAGMATLFYGLGGIFLLVGVVLTLGGLIGARKRRAEIGKLDSQGVPATGQVTYVDRNYSIRVNGNPIYSIVEFTFKDSSGVERTSRKEDVSSEMVIRNKIEVGSQVEVKYLMENPDENMLVLHDPRDGSSSPSV